MLETSAFQVFHSGNSTFINSFDKTKFLFFLSLPPTQHHSFFRDYKFMCQLLLWVWGSEVAAKPLEKATRSVVAVEGKAIDLESTDGEVRIVYAFSSTHVEIINWYLHLISGDSNLDPWILI